MDSRDVIRTWLEGQIEKKGHGARKKLAECLGVGSSAITRMTSTDPGKETREITAAELLKMAEFFGEFPPLFPPAEDPNEHKRVPLGQEFDPDPEFEPARAGVSSGHRFGIGTDEIPQAETMGLGLRDAGDQIQIDIGGGSSVIGVPVSDTWRVPSTVLRRRVSTPIEQLHFVECEGNSMYPLINNGDVVLVDRSKRNPRMPGVFALWEGDGQTIKQVEFVQGSVPPRLRLIPANKDYTTYEVLTDDVFIIGAYVARFTVD